MRDLDAFDRVICNFLWSGQVDSKKPRVEYAILLRPKSNGGFGLIFVRAQFVAMAGVFILNASTDGDGTLQHIVCKNIGDFSVVQSGNHDFSWLVSPHATRPN